MANLEEAATDQLTITVDQLNIEAHEAPSQPSGTNHEKKAVFKTGLFVTLISIGGILYPPISATVSKTHGFPSQTLHFMVFPVSLATGILLMLLYTVLHRHPRLIVMAKALTQIGWGLLSIALGYGSALVLMVSPPPP